MSPPLPDLVQRIPALRAAMQSRQVHACIIPTSDPHLSEYLPERWQGRQWLSGFDGSAGTLVVSATYAGLWTDSRYWEQADHDLQGTDITLMRAGQADVPGPAAWLADHLAPAQRVSVDGQVLALQTYRQWQEILAAKDIALLTDIDVLDDIWVPRPALPSGTVFEHLPPFACRSRAQNLADVRSAMMGHKADWHWLSSLDDIA